MKKLKPGQIFTMYGKKWRVQKHVDIPLCKSCEILQYWWECVGDPLKDPCKLLCGIREVLPNNCNTKRIIKK